MQVIFEVPDVLPEGYKYYYLVFNDAPGEMHSQETYEALNKKEMIEACVTIYARRHESDIKTTYWWDFEQKKWSLE